MIANRPLSQWDDIVGSATLITIILLALCVMVRAVKIEDIFRRLGAIVGVAILLIVLPAIIVGLWNSMYTWQRLGVTLIIIAVLFLGSKANGKSKKPRSQKN